LAGERADWGLFRRRAQVREWVLLAYGLAACNGRAEPRTGLPRSTTAHSATSVTCNFTKCPPQLSLLYCRLAASKRQDYRHMQPDADHYAVALLQPHSRPVRCKVTHHRYKHACTTTCSASASVPGRTNTDRAWQDDTWPRTWCHAVPCTFDWH
jgi:hypothetical protein